MNLKTLKPRLHTHKPTNQPKNWGNGRGGRPWRRLRDMVLARDMYTCQSCQRVGGRLEIDHIVNTAQGGTDSMNNLQTLCHQCHKTKTQAESTLGAGKKFVSIT